MKGIKLNRNISWDINISKSSVKEYLLGIYKIYVIHNLDQKLLQVYIPTLVHRNYETPMKRDDIALWLKFQKNWWNFTAQAELGTSTYLTANVCKQAAPLKNNSNKA